LEVKSSPEADKIIQNSKFALVKPVKSGSKWVCDLNDVEVQEIQRSDKSAVSDSKEIIFVIESYGNMPAKDIFLGAIDALGENLDEFNKFVSKNA
jgi:hypothetical protein